MAARDPQGIPFPTATDRGMALYARALGQMSTFHAGVFDTLDAAQRENPEFGMPWFARAYLGLYLTDPGGRDAAIEAMRGLRAVIDPARLSPEEQGHARAIDAWIGGDLPRACAILDGIGLESPRELLALRVGHEADFFVGDLRNLHDRVARQLPAWSPADPHYGVVLGAWAFGLGENGRHEAAEAAGLQALALQPRDAWALHAVAHAHEMLGRPAQGLRFLEERRADWAVDNLFAGHNAWHAALFRLDAGDVAGALRAYDAELFNPGTPRFAIVLVDPSALLWRLHLEGTDVSDRARALSRAWTEVLPPSPYYAFNELHAAMAHVAAGELDTMHERIGRLDAWIDAGTDRSHDRRVLRELGRPACAALLAFGEGRWDECTDRLAALRRTAHGLGGSAAQRDVLDRTLHAAAMRAGRYSVARAVSAERIAGGSDNPSQWRRHLAALQALRAPDAQQAAARDGLARSVAALSA